MNVMNHYYINTPKVVLLEVKPKKLSAAVVEENLENGEELFPHIYGEVLVYAIVKYHHPEKNGSENWQWSLDHKEVREIYIY